jgi:hypothetical protein
MWDLPLPHRPRRHVGQGGFKQFRRSHPDAPASSGILPIPTALLVFLPASGPQRASLLPPCLAAPSLTLSRARSVAEGVTSVHRSGEIASMAPKGRTELEVGAAGNAVIAIVNPRLPQLLLRSSRRRPPAPSRCLRPSTSGVRLHIRAAPGVFPPAPRTRVAAGGASSSGLCWS